MAGSRCVVARERRRLIKGARCYHARLGGAKRVQRRGPRWLPGGPGLGKVPFVTIVLSSRQRQYLKSLGHHLSPVVHMGHQGVTDQLSAETERGLAAHELIKVKLGEHAPGDRHALAEALAKHTQASVVQVIGRVALLYRSRPVDPTIVLPREAGAPPPPKAPKEDAAPARASKGKKAAGKKGGDKAPARKTPTRKAAKAAAPEETPDTWLADDGD